MKSNRVRARSGGAAAAPPAKRFRVRKLEERIAPRIHFNPQSRLVGGGGGSYTCTI